MKQSLAVVCSILSMGFSGVLAAQAPANGIQAERIVTVGFTNAVLQTAEGKRDFGALQTKYAPRQAQLQTLNSEVETLRKQLSSAGVKMTEDERQAREKTLDSEEKQLQRQADDFQNDTQAESQQVYQRIAQKLFAFLQTYAQQNGFTMVIDRGSDRAPVVWYAAPGADITDQLIKAYDKHVETTQHGDSNGMPTGPARLPPTPTPH
ncbi:MAG: OmpH family outer membrane protein [Acidobacteriaceae bacterium]